MGDIYIDIYVPCVYIRTELYDNYRTDNHTTKTGQNWIPNSWTCYKK